MTSEERLEELKKRLTAIKHQGQVGLAEPGLALPALCEVVVQVVDTIEFMIDDIEKEAGNG